jgi:hypothetical protein
MSTSITFPKGYVTIRTSLPLDTVAEKISAALSIDLKKAPTGRFEEYEGYQCDTMGFRIYLLGNDPFKPISETHIYELSVMPSQKLAFPEGSIFDETDISSFLQQMLIQIPDLDVIT